MVCGSVKSPSPNGPITSAGGEVAEHRAEADPLEERHRHHAGGEQGHDADEVGPMHNGGVGHPAISCLTTARL